MVETANLASDTGVLPYLIEGIGVPLSSLWDDVTRQTGSAGHSPDAAFSGEMAVRDVVPGEGRRGRGESMDLTVRRLVAEKHPEHFDHFVLKTEILRSPGGSAEIPVYPNLHVHRYHVWVNCQCGADLLLE